MLNTFHLQLDPFPGGYLEWIEDNILWCSEFLLTVHLNSSSFSNSRKKSSLSKSGIVTTRLYFKYYNSFPVTTFFHHFETQLRWMILKLHFWIDIYILNIVLTFIFYIFIGSFRCPCTIYSQRNRKKPSIFRWRTHNPLYFITFIWNITGILNQILDW